MKRKELSPFAKELLSIVTQANALNVAQHASLDKRGQAIVATALSEAKQHLPARHTSGALGTELNEP